LSNVEPDWGDRGGLRMEKCGRMGVWGYGLTGWRAGLRTAISGGGAACAVLRLALVLSGAGAFAGTAGESSLPAEALDAPAVRRLTRDGKYKQHLAWSPDGGLLAFSYYHAMGRISVALLDPATSAIRVLDKDPVEFGPSWSPDGKRLAYVHDTQSGTDGELDVYQMNADGTDRKPLAVIAGKSFDGFPSWSPDGKQLVFTTTRDKTQEIYVADADGTNQRRLTSDPSLKQHPCWSPDGKRIAFNDNRDGNFEIYVMDADGKNPRRLTSHPAQDLHPVWSPDGKRLAWITMRDENPEIYVMNADGSGARNVSRYDGYDWSPAWTPDGKSLTWVSDRDGRYDVYSFEVHASTAPGAGATRSRRYPGCPARQGYF
jgi:TolB protein